MVAVHVYLLSGRCIYRCELAPGDVTEEHIKTEIKMNLSIRRREQRIVALADQDGLVEVTLVLVAQLCVCESKVGLRLCGRCKVASYCCSECQRRHWSVHKLTCCQEDRRA